MAFLAEEVQVTSMRDKFPKGGKSCLKILSSFFIQFGSADKECFNWESVEIEIRSLKKKDITSYSKLDHLFSKIRK